MAKTNDFGKLCEENKSEQRLFLFDKFPCDDKTKTFSSLHFQESVFVAYHQLNLIIVLFTSVSVLSLEYHLSSLKRMIFLLPNHVGSSQ